jgi:hypothetical protein
MSKVTTGESVSAQFQASADEINTIFSSFRSLYDIYSASFNILSNSLEGLPVPFKEKVNNSAEAFKNASATVDSEQKEISNKLYAQGLVLLVGNAESLTREMFKTLLRKNIRKLQISRKIQLPLDDVLSADSDEKLGSLVIGILEGDKNPAEKLNFQNMRQLQGIMSNYLGIQVEEGIVQGLHLFWQIRHLVIHNASVISQQFLNNLKAAKISIDSYKLGELIIFTKQQYDECFGLLVLLFENLDNQIIDLDLKYSLD